MILAGYPFPNTFLNFCYHNLNMPNPNLLNLCNLPMTLQSAEFLIVFSWITTSILILYILPKCLLTIL